MTSSRQPQLELAATTLLVAALPGLRGSPIRLGEDAGFGKFKLDFRYGTGFDGDESGFNGGDSVLGVGLTA